jgi:hypothetical protein
MYRNDCLVLRVWTDAARDARGVLTFSDKPVISLPARLSVLRNSSGISELELTSTLVPHSCSLSSLLGVIISAPAPPPQLTLDSYSTLLSVKRQAVTVSIYYPIHYTPLTTRWVPTNTYKSSTQRSRVTSSNSSLEYDVGNTDNSPLSTEHLDLPDPTRLGDWVTRPSRVTLSTGFELGGETGRSPHPRVLPTVNPSGRVSTT